MGSVDRFPALSPNLGECGDTILIPEASVLTPRLCVVVAVLYMMAVDNDVSDFESSQLQGVVGSDADTLKKAVAYKENNDVERFLVEAPPLLDKQTRLCLLTNVCDSLMADKVVAPAEERLLDRMLVAMGHTKASFQPYFEAIKLKNNTAVFGDFDAATKTEVLTPPLALVVSLIYMMAADGSMAEEEVGRLNASVGGSPALLKVGLRYVSKVRAPQFLALAAPILDEAQRLCILLNACDAMMADHEVAKVERDLFRRMLNAFEVSEKKFEKYLNIIFLKNDVPDVSRPVPATGKNADIPAALAGQQQEKHVFQRKKTWEEETGEAGQATALGNRDLTHAAGSEVHTSDMETRISNTMRENVDQLSGELDGDISLKAMESNARAKKSNVKKRSSAGGASDLRTIREKDVEVSKKNKIDAHDGPADQRALRSGDGDTNAQKAVGVGDGPADQRALRDGEGDTNAQKAIGASEGPADQRALRDGEGDTNAQKAIGASEGPADQRALRDGEGDTNAQKAIGASEGPADQRALRDGEGDTNAQKAGIGHGPADPRALRDTDADINAKKAADSLDGPSDPRSLRDNAADNRAGASDIADHTTASARARQDAAGPGVSARPAGMSPALGRHLWNTDKPGDRRELRDAGGVPADRRIADARFIFDPAANDSDEGSAQADAINQRMDATRDLTYKIFGYVEAIESARSIVAASRLPLLPILPVTGRMVAPVQGINYQDIPGARAAWDDGKRTLLASDQGGPIMSEQQGSAPANVNEANTNRKLRHTSAVLLPALFLTYGATMVGETAMQHGFVVNENIATDARIVHQMASVQQTVYRIAPESVTLAIDKLQTGIVQAAGAGGSASIVAVGSNGAAAGGATPNIDDKELSDRTKADQFLEQRKQELKAVAQSHQGASAVAAERQQWFIYAKSIVLLGLGMAFWGVLFKSMRMLNVSTAVGLLSLFLTANGYWLFVRL